MQAPHLLVIHFPKTLYLTKKYQINIISQLTGDEYSLWNKTRHTWKHVPSHIFHVRMLQTNVIERFPLLYCYDVANMQNVMYLTQIMMKQYLLQKLVKMINMIKNKPLYLKLFICYTSQKLHIKYASFNRLGEVFTSKS